ncbi:MAG: hypothetical protein ACLT5A_01015 [Clostridiaceae bacterium]
MRTDFPVCLAELEILERRPEDPETGTAAESLVTHAPRGKFHQVKRMMEETGCPVLHLKRCLWGR